MAKIDDFIEAGLGDLDHDNDVILIRGNGRTISDGVGLTSDFTALLKDAFSKSRIRMTATISSSSGRTVGGNIWRSMTWGNTILDTHSFATGDGSGFTIPTGCAGTYIANLTTEADVNEDGNYFISRVLVDVSEVDRTREAYRSTANPTRGDTSFWNYFIAEFSDGDVITAEMYMADAVTRSTLTGNLAKFSITRIF